MRGRERTKKTNERRIQCDDDGSEETKEEDATYSLVPRTRSATLPIVVIHAAWTAANVSKSTCPPLALSAPFPLDDDIANPRLLEQRFLKSEARSLVHSWSKRNVSQRKIPRCAASRSERQMHIVIAVLSATL